MKKCNKRRKPLISIITAGYNCEKSIMQTVESVLSQTYTNIEYIYVDDCSEDQSFSSVKKVNDTRIISVKNEKNMGQSHSLNRAVRLARGDYIAVVDADDICLEDRIEKQYEAFLDNKSAVVSCSGYYVVDENDKLIREHRLNMTASECAYRLNFSNIIAHSTVMYNKKSIDINNLYSVRYGIAENYELMLKIVNTYNVAIVNEPTIIYRILTTGITRKNKQKMIDAVYYILHSHYKNMYNIELGYGKYIRTINSPTIKYIAEQLKLRKLIYTLIKKNNSIHYTAYIKEAMITIKRSIKNTVKKNVRRT